MSKKPAWLFNQSAVIPCIEGKGTLQVVLVTSKKSKTWTIPKGVIDRGMSPEESAAKEALEEAGLIGKVSSEILAEFEYEKWGGICHVRVYLLKVDEILDEWDEMATRERTFVDIDKAVQMVRNELKPILLRFQEMFNVGN